MIWTMTRKALWDLRWATFWYALGLALYIVLLAAFYPATQELGAQVEELLRTYPEALLRAFGIDSEVGTLTTFAGFMHAQVFGLLWPLVAAIFVIMSGAATVAQEVERGTADLWLSVPASRPLLLSGKLAALLFAILVVVVVSVLTLLASAWVLAVEFSLIAALQLGIVLFTFLVAIAGLSVLSSSLFSERGKAAAMVAALVLAMYLAWVIAGLSDRFSWLRYVSLFTAYQPRQALEGRGSSWEGLLALVAIGVGGALVSLVLFRRRDLVA